MHVKAHLWTPFQTMKKFFTGDPQSVDSHRAALLSLQDPEPVANFAPSQKVSSLFDLGEPPESKPACLNTEVGEIVFTGDMLASLNTMPSPLNKKEAVEILTQAAERYARLTAFVAAEQNMTCDELLALNKGGPPREKSEYPHPRDTLDAIGRYTTTNEAELVMYTLDGTRQEDLQTIKKAANGYCRYLWRNGHAVGFERHHNEANVAAAQLVIEERDPEDWQADSLYSMRTESINQSGYPRPLPPAKAILDSIGEDTLEKFNNPELRDTRQPFIEEYPSGVAIHLDAEKSVEIVNRYGISFNEPLMDTREWYRKIRRIVKRNGKRYVVAEQEIFDEISALKPAFLKAVNFREPLT